jgi:hypothetical protein
MKRISAQQAEQYTCTCGNTVNSSGFYAVDPHGFQYYGDDPAMPDGPPEDSDWQGHYKCQDCNEVHMVTWMDTPYNRPNHPSTPAR